MARSQKSSGKRTSFGKQTDAEKDFYKSRKGKSFSKRKENDDASGSYSRSGRTKSFNAGRSNRFASEDKGQERSEGFQRKASGDKRFSSKSSKPYAAKGGSRFGKKSEDGEKRFSSRNSGSFERRDNGGFEKKRFSDKPSKPFRERGNDRFEKKRSGDEAGFSKRRSGSFESRDNAGFEKKRFSDKPSRPFRERNDRFEKKKPGEEGSFSKRRSGSFDGGDKPRFERKRFDSRKKYASSGSNESEGRGESRFKKPYEKKTRKSFVESRISKARTSADVTPERQKTDSDLIRLNKFLANAGVGSRREADELIKMGLVTVNGTAITEMGYKVKATDDVRYEGKKMKAEKLVYILLNKPKGFITTTDDPQERNTVMGLVASACKERIYPVGRLDRNTTGLLLLTNDGDLADKLTHPSYNAKKIYKVELDKPLTRADFEKIQEGVRLEEGRAVPDDLAIVSDDKKTIGIELHIGWNRIVRRIFEALEYQVVKLDRVVYAGLDKKDLGRGQWRFLKPEEVVRLKHFN